MVAMYVRTESLVVFTPVHSLMPCRPHSLGMLAEFGQKCCLSPFWRAVERTYQALLGRNLDPEGLAY
jgi:hypothetical protein